MATQEQTSSWMSLNKRYLTFVISLSMAALIANDERIVSMSGFSSFIAEIILNDTSLELGNR